MMVWPERAPRCVVPARNAHFQYIAENMRPDEIEHWKAVTGALEYNPDVAAGAFIAGPGIKFTVLDANGTPACAGGFQDMGFGVWEGWMAGTMSGWSSTWRSMTKGARWYMGYLFQHQNARRICITTVATRTCATDWYQRALGMRLDGTMRAAGAHGEDMVTYSRISGDSTP